MGAGGSLLDPAITEKVMERLRSAASIQSEPFAQLNDQERNILTLLAEGKTNKQIADAINLSPHTVKNYVSEIFKKLGVARRSEAAVFYTSRTTKSDK